jgi:dTDP-4-amino-4,6-dideoxygalactose transaminase
MTERIFLSAPHMGGDEIKFVQEAFDTNWISPAGPNITAFEEELSQYLDGVSVAALSSGTAAIHLALILLGVGQGDEVLCSTFTFSGTCNPIAYQGATPVFVDSEVDTWNMSPDLLREAIEGRTKVTGKKPKAIVIVHLYGMPAKIDELMAIARAYDIPVIEDAAEALGSVYKGKKCGTFGDFGILSFNGNKIITTSGGGALTSSNAELINRARFLATQARDPAPHYQHSVIGYNYRLSNICAGIGRGQLKVLEERVEKRRHIFEWYQNALSGFATIQYQPQLQGSYSNRWLTCIVSDKGSAEPIRLALEKDNIESRPLWKPMHQQPVFKSAPYFGEGVSDSLFERGLCLPSGSSLGEEQLKRVTDIVIPILAG